MKRKITNHSFGKFLCCVLILLASFSIKGFAQPHMTMSITNCTVTANEFQFDFILLNDGNQSLKFNSASLRMVHAIGIVPSGTNTYAWTYIAGTTDFPAAFATLPTTYNMQYTAASRLMQLTMSTGNYVEGNAITLPIGVPMRVGRFSMKITNTNWVSGQNVGIAYFSSGNGAVLYVNGATTTTNFNQTTPTTTTLNPPCPLVTPAGCNVTSGVSNNISVTCFGGSDGSATVTLTNATAPVTWTINSSAAAGTGTTNTFSGLAANSYTVSYSDNNGCTGTASFVISGPSAPLSMDACTHNDVTCNGGNNGSVSAGAVTNNVGTINYNWNNSGGTSVGTTSTVSSLVAGTYTLTVTDDCGSITCSQTISQPSLALSMGSCQSSNVTCFGGNNGSVTAGTLSNTTGNIIYNWQNSGGTSVGTTAMVSNLVAGTYTLTVTDDCATVTCSQTITQPAAAMTMGTCTHTDVSCNGASTGSVTAGAITNGVGTIVYNWKNSGGTTVGTTATVNNLPAGTFTLTVTDDCGTTATCSQTIVQPTTTMTMGTCTSTNVTCFGGTDGTVSAGAISNSSGTVVYNWKNSGGTTVGTTATVSNRAAGTYTLTVNDNCTQLTCTVTVTQPAALMTMSSCSSTNVTCFNGNNGTLTAGTLSNSVGTVTYNWRNSGGTTVGTTATVSNRTAGTYTLTVTDGCTSVTCSQTITQPASGLSMGTCTHTNVTCFGGNNGSVTAGSVTNSTGTVNYNWKNSGGTSVGTTAMVSNLVAGTYTLSVTDDCGMVTCSQTITQPAAAMTMGTCTHTDVSCNGASTGSVTAGAITNGVGTIVYNWKNSGGTTVGTTATVNNLPAGTFTLTVTDDCGTTATCSQTIVQPTTTMTMGTCTSTNVTCFGGTNGTISAGAISNSSGTVVYNWKNSGGTTVGTTATVSNRAAGTYTLTVNDNCTQLTCTVTVTQPAALMTMSACSSTNVTCFNGNNGTLTAGTLSNSVGTVTYNWRNSGGTTVGTTATVSNRTAGTYTLTVTDGCTSVTCSQTITQPASGLSMGTCTHTNVTCFGGNNGSVTAGSVTNSTGTVNYNWKNSGGTSVGTTAMVSNLVAGTYTLSVTDDCGMVTCSQTITQPAAAMTMGTCTHTDVSCNGASTGSVTAGAITNGVGTIVYNWKNSGGTTVGTTATVNNLPAGTFTLTVTDDCGTTRTCSQTITQTAATMTMGTCTSTNVTCFGGTNGTVSAGAISNSSGTVVYNWKNSGGTTVGTTATVSNRAAGTYTLTVNDNCTQLTCTVTVTQPAALMTMSACSSTNVTCFNGNNGTLTAGTLSNSVGTVTYNWRNSGGTTVGTTATVSNRTAGTYTLTVTDGCTSVTCSQTITQPASGLSMGTCTHTNVTCFGGNNGSVTAGSVTNSTGTVNYNWKNSGGTSVGTTAMVNNLIAGTYTLSVTDDCGMVTCSQTITQPAAAMTMGTCTHTDITCGGSNTGSVTAGAITNGVGTIVYNWKNSGGTTVGTTATVNNLPAGTFTLTVTDDCGTTRTCSQTINQGAALSMTACTHTDVGCAGGSTGSVSAGTLSNVTGTAQYNWQNSGGTTVGTTSVVNNLPAGTYTLTVTDNCGFITCVQTINQPTASNLIMDPCSHTDVICFGASTGSVSAGVVSGAGGTVQYSWKNSGNTTIGTTATVSNLPAGTYTLTVTDGCGTVTCSQTILQPQAALSMTACSSVDAPCGGTGSVSAGIVSNNVGTVTYNWKNSGGTTVGTTSTVNNLPVGSYTLTASDDCGSVTCVQSISSPSSVSGTVTTTNAGCNVSDGTATVNPSGGTIPYTYEWNPGGQTTQTAVNLAGGTYTVTITDDGGCTGTASGVVQSSGGTAPAPGPISGSLAVCKGQCIVYSISPVQGATSYIWTLPAGATGSSTSTSITICFGSRFRGGNLCVKTVTPCGNSVNTCIFINKVSGKPSKPGSISGPITLCPGQSATYSVSSVANASGYIWTTTGGITITGGQGTNSITVSAPTNFTGGSVGVKATNCKGSSSTRTLNISLSNVGGTITTVNAGCQLSNGSATVNPSGGTSPYTYLWNPGGETTQTISNLAAGTYVVTVTDDAGCSGTATAVVQSVGPAPVAINGPTSVCKGQCGVVYSVSPVAGAISYIWTTPSGASGSSTGTSITLCFNTRYRGGFLCVRAVSPCGTSQSICIFINDVHNQPGTPGSISGPLSLCPGNTATYSISAVSGASNYVWTTTGGLIIGPGQGTTTVEITAPAGFISGSVKVKAQNCKGSSGNRTINVIGLPSTPVWKYAPPLFACGGGCYGFNIDNVQDANTFTFEGPPGSVITSVGAAGSGNPITTTKSFATICFPSGFTSGTITMFSTNNCGNSAPLIYNISSTPPAPSVIYGHSSGMCNSSNNSYVVPSVPGATSYTWTVPTGAQITHNYGNLIKVKYTSNFSSGDVCVSINSACGSSSQTCLSVMAVPRPPSVIDGPISVCRTQTNVEYSNPGSFGATSFSWSVSGGAIITSGNGSRKVKLNFNGVSTSTVLLTVSAMNACGSSTQTTLSINVNPNCRVSETEIQSFDANLIAYPNPTSGKSTLTFNAEANGKYLFTVVDLLGKEIVYENIDAVEGLNVKEINLDNAAKGIYIVSLSSSGVETKSLRLIVH